MTRAVPLGTALLAAAALGAALAACGGDPTGPESLYPQSFLEVAAGDSHTCATSSGGRTFCWGNHGLSRLGHPGTGLACDDAGCFRPIRMRESLPFTALSAGEAHTCGITDGQGFCWGFDRFGQLGDDGQVLQRCPEDTPFRCSPDPAPVAIGVPLALISAARMHSCALTADGQAVCWGWNIAGQLGRGNKDLDPHPEPRLVEGDHRFTDLDTAYGHTCAVTAAGVGYCWGSGEFGRLGTGDLSEHSIPTPVAGDISFRQISPGATFTCGVATDGGVRCWGWGLAGRLGTGTEDDQLEPARALVPEPAVFVSAGHGHSCALGQSGDLYCWGANDSGQLGIGDFVDRLAPERVPLPEPVLQVSAGRWHTCAITQARRLYCWGGNYTRQLGDGTVHVQSAPALVNP